jgi:hypothetical protein
MLKLWSEVPDARAHELAADTATLLWVGVCVMGSRRLYDVLAAFTEAGRVIRDGGRHLTVAGMQVGDTLGGIPVIGIKAGELVSYAFAFAARPFVQVGTYLERILLIFATLFSLIVLLGALALWLQRYIPWRWSRLRRLHAAQRVIRASTQASGSEIERLLASRALHRLPYRDLLKYSPDPFGDWASGHYARLASAELASVGLRPRAPLSS